MSGKDKKAKKAHKVDRLQIYYADDALDDEENQPENKKIRNALIDEEEEQEAENVNLDDEKSKEKLKKENMDKLSDILVNLIFKNRVNSKNAFDVPLPDVQQLTDFHQASGDSSWKKLSQTLDAGARIYGFRVDSVHNETYKVLGGLNRSDLNEAIQEEMRKDDEELPGKKTKKDTEGESTLEKNFSNLDSNKYDLEFDIDPLFQKTSAKFDEGGAKGLLLNNLIIDLELNLMFDSSGHKELLNQDEDQNKNIGKHFTGADLKEMLMGEEFLAEKLCPELTTFKQTYLKDKDFITDIHYAEVAPNYKSDKKLRFENIDVDADQILNDLGQYGEGEYNDPQPLENFQYQEDEVEPSGVVIDDNTNGLENVEKPEKPVDKELNFVNIGEKLASLGHGQSLNTLLPDHKAWMGPDAWKIKLKNQKKAAEKKPRTIVKKKGKTVEVSINFDLSSRETIKDVFGVQITKKRVIHKEVVADIKQTYLLPIDMHIKATRLANLFMRGLDHKRAVWKKNQPVKVEDTLIEFNMPPPEDDEVVEHPQEHGHEEIQQNLDTIFGKGDQYDKNEKHINIKVLKEKIWGFISDRVTDVNPDDDDDSILINSRKHGSVRTKKSKKKGDDEDAPLAFSEICQDLPNLIAGQINKNISIHSCFVTVLHLANEKGLRFARDGEDFRIFRETVN